MPRRSLVDASAHKAEIEHLLIELRWGSRTVAKYLETKYGETIPDSTLRTWRQRRLDALDKKGKLPAIWKEPGDPNTAKGRVQAFLTPADELPDIVTRRLALARLQEERIRIDSEHEFSMGKLFTSGTKEIDLLNKIYSDIKQDMQELGLLPQLEKVAATQVNVTATGGQAAAISSTPVPSDKTLDELTHGVDPSVLAEAGRALMLVKGEVSDDH